MKAQDLRIGNYVDWNGEIGILSQLLEKDVCFKCGEECLYEDLKPIPLTEEWLLKFGFEKSVEYKTKFNFLRFHLLQINASNAYNDNFNEFSVTVYQFNQSIEICRLKYVHQLQNLYFALTGEELIIKQ